MHRIRPGLVLAAVTFILYTATFAGHYVMGDHAYRMAWAKALLDRGDHDISDYIPGTRYSPYGVGHTFLHVPLLVIDRGIKRATGLACEGPVNMYLYVLNGVLGVVLIYRIALRYGVEPTVAAYRVAGVAVASVWFPYTKLEYSESLVATALLGMWLAAPARPLVAGLVAGLSVTFRTEALLFAGITGLFAPGKPSAKLKMVLAALPGVGLTMWANWVRTGTVYTSGYAVNGFNNPVWVGLYGILFSAGKSIFLFSPLLLLVWPAVKRAATLPGGRRFAAWAVTLLAAQAFLYASWWDWSGDDSWGVRFVIAGVMAVQAVVVVGWPSRAAWAVVAAGIFVQLPAVLLGPHTSLMCQHVGRPQKEALYLGSREPVSIDDMRYHPRYSQVVASWELAAIKLGSTPPRSSLPSYTGTTWSEGFATRPAVEWDIFWLTVLTQRGR